MNDKKAIDEMIIEFEGRGNSRNEFLGSFFERAESFLDMDNHEERTVLRVLIEIVKNIHDHAFGWGYLIIKRLENGSLKIEAGNTILPKSEIPELPEKDWKNHGLGLKEGMIFGYAESIGLELTLDVEAGYVFRGTYKS